ncbi:MAG: hypothetical protein OHK003_02740 [Anaerolineales bacterium]
MFVNHVVLGTGAIGRAVMNELVKRGESVRMVNRSGKMYEVPAGVEVVAADLYDQAKVKEVTRGAKVVYQASQPNYNEWTTKFPALQKSIIDGLTGTDAKLVLVENLYMYGETNGTPMTEDLPHNVHTRKGKVRSEMSNAAFEAHRAGKLKSDGWARLRLLRSVGIASCDDGRAHVLPDAAWQSGRTGREYRRAAYAYVCA